MSEQILIMDDDRSIGDSLASLLEGPGRRIFVCPDVESAEMVLARHPVTHVVTDVQFSGPFGFEGLYFLKQFRGRMPECRIVLMTGNSSDALRKAALDLGAATVLAKPFEASELLDALGLAEWIDTPPDGCEVTWFPEIQEIFESRALKTVYQPIVDLQRPGNGPFGFEALTRLERGWPEDGIAGLFEYAARKDRLPDLNVAALDRALLGATALPDGAILFVNIDPQTFDRYDVPARLRAAAERSAFPLSRVVLEITERSAFTDQDVLTRGIAGLHAAGVRFALDDHGSAHSHLSEIESIRPSFIKISQQFGTGFEKDQTRTRIVRNIVALARDFGCVTILEGIEGSDTAGAAAEAGIELGQGYHFGRPSDQWSVH